MFQETSGRVQASGLVSHLVNFGNGEWADIRRVQFHDCRDTYASLLIQQGANVKYIQEQLGHGSISITLDIYSHLFHGDHRHHVHRLDDP